MRPLRTRYASEKIDTSDFLDFADGGDVASDVIYPCVASVLGVIVREEDGDGIARAEGLLLENDFVEMRGDGHAVAGGHAPGRVVRIAHVVAVLVEHRAGNHKEVATVLRPDAHERFEPFPGVPVKRVVLRRHVGIKVGVDHHRFAGLEVGIGREMTLVVGLFEIIGAEAGGVGGQARVGPETFHAVAFPEDVVFGDLVSDPERDAQVVIVPGEVILLVEEIFGSVRRGAGHDRRGACGPPSRQAVGDVFGFGRFLLRGREEERLVVLRFPRIRNLTARA